MASDAFYQAYVEIVPEGSKLLKGINKEFDSAAPAAGKNAGEKLSAGILGSFAGVAAGITGLIVGAVGAIAAGSALKGGIDRLLNIEDASAKLRGLGNDAATVDAIMADALASVKGTAFGLDAAATTAAGAVAAGIKPGQELEKYLRLTADAATIAGTSLGEMGSILNKVTTSGKAQADNLNQLADRGIPIYQWLAEEYGVTADELSKMVSRGEVDSETFRRVIEKNIGGAALSSGDTTRGAFANMLASLNRVAANLLSGVFPQFKKLFQGITSFLGPVETAAKGVGVAIGGFFERAIPAAQGLFDLIGRGDFTSGLRAATGWVEDSQIVDVLLMIREKAIEAGSALRENLGSVFGGLADAITPLIPAVVDLWTQFSPFSLILQALAPLVPQIAAVLASLGESISIVLGSIVDALPLILPGLGELAVALGGALALALAAIAPLLPEIAQAFADLVTGIVPLLPQIIALVPVILQLLPPLLQLISQVLPPLIDLLGLLLPGAIAAVSFIINSILIPALTWVIGNLNGLFEALNIVFELWSGDIGNTEFVGKITQIGGGFGELIRIIQSAAQAIVQFVMAAVANIRNFATSVGTGIGEAIGFFASLPGRVADVFSGVSNWLFSAGKDLLGGFIDGIKSMVGAVGDAIGGVLDFAAGFFPHSPALRGPFAGSGWTDIKGAGEAIVDQFGLGLSATERLSIGAATLTAASLPAITDFRVSGSDSNRPIYTDTGSFFGTLVEMANGQARLVLDEGSRSRRVALEAGRKF